MLGGPEEGRAAERRGGAVLCKAGQGWCRPCCTGRCLGGTFRGACPPQSSSILWGAKGDHNPSPEQVFSKCLIFSTEGKADLHLKSQTFKTRGPERETISSHKLNVCSKLPFPKSQGFGALHAPAGPCLSASLVRGQTTQTSVMMSKQTLMNFGARLVLAFMGHKIIRLLLPALTCQRGNPEPSQAGRGRQDQSVREAGGGGGCLFIFPLHTNPFLCSDIQTKSWHARCY